MSATLEAVASLDEAIQQQIALGERDPIALRAKVLSLYGEDQVRAWTADLYLEALNRRAHELCGLVRRRNEQVADEQGPSRPYYSDWLAVPLPDGSFESVRRGAMTVEQHLAVERRERALARGHLRTAKRARRDAQLLTSYGVDCLDDLPKGIDWPEAA